MVIVFDLTNRESFFHIQDWVDEITKYTGQNIIKLAIANKSDLTKEIVVTKDEISEFEKKTGINVIRVSAKTGEYVDYAFKVVTEMLIEKKYLFK